MCSIKTSNRKYILEAAGFYDAIHERSYFSPSNNKDSDACLLQSLNKQFRIRYAVIYTLLLNYDKALSIIDDNGDDPSLEDLRGLLHVLISHRGLMHSADVPIQSKIYHVILIVGKCSGPKFGELTVRSCQMLSILEACYFMDAESSTRRSPSKSVFDSPSYCQLQMAIASAIQEMPKDMFLLLFIDDENCDLSPPDLESFTSRGHQIMLISSKVRNMKQNNLVLLTMGSDIIDKQTIVEALSKNA